MSDLTFRRFACGRDRTETFHAHGAVSALIAKLLIMIGTWIARSRGRKALYDLAERNDQHLLKDIGLTRGQAFREAAKWFWRR